MTAVTAHVRQVQEWIGGWPTRAAVSTRRAASLEARNGDALASYLFGILSALPLLGLLFGVPAVVLGARGLRQARVHPGAGGALQCRIGMALGAFFAMLYLAVSLFLILVLI